jgi:hypothetical protein
MTMADYFRRSATSEVCDFLAIINERVLAPFRDLEGEANRITKAEFNRIANSPAGELGEIDMGGASESSFDIGLRHYEALEPIRQAVLNMVSVALYHLFEQRLIEFCNRELVDTERPVRVPSRNQAEQHLEQIGISPKTLGSWQKTDEFRLVANVAKHGDGESNDRLQPLRPDLFEHPLLRGSELMEETHASINYTRSGKDLAIRFEDLQEYCDAVVSFYSELADELDRIQ